MSSRDAAANAPSNDPARRALQAQSTVPYAVPTAVSASILSGVLERAVADFEKALRAGNHPHLEDYLPGNSPARARILVELIHTELEYRLKAGERDLAADYLTRYPELAADRAAAIGLILAEYQIRRRLDSAIAPEDVIQRFPAYRDELATCLGSGEGPCIPGYEVLCKLGQGGMGVVYKARDLRLGRTVALKMVLSGEHADEAERVRFRNEVEAVAQLQHPNVVPLFESGRHNGVPYFTLEFMEGGSLADRLRDHPMAPEQAAHLLEQVAHGVQHAHERGILHRDLKPGNVLLTRDGTPRVIDFGLAKRLDLGTALTVTGNVMGTPAYMAPEQARGDAKRVGPAADVYSLGAVLYQCLTGQPPFRAATPAETLLRVLTEEPVLVRMLAPKCPRDLETICQKCLQKEPARRYVSARALAEDLRRFQEGEPIQARPVGPIERAVKWARRRPTAAALVGLSVLLCAGAVVGGFVYEWQLRATRDAARAQSLLDALRSAETPAVGRIVEELAEVRSRIEPELRRIRDDPEADPRERLHASLALLPGDAEQVGYLTDRLLTAQPTEVQTIRAALQPHAADVTEGLWLVALDTRADGGRRLRAACVLAGCAPHDARWTEAAPAVVQQLLTEKAPVGGPLTESLRPARAALLGPLVDVFRDAERPDVEQRLAASVLADYAADRPELLTALLEEADAVQYGILFPAIQKHRARAVAVFKAALARTVGPDWNDAPLDPAWTMPDAEAVQQIEKAHGLVAERFALCQTLPQSQLDGVATALRRAGYRPIRFRPYRVTGEAAGGSVRAAVLWTRDGRDWQLAQDRTGAELLALDEKMRASGCTAVDVAGYLVPERDSTGERYAGVWVRRARDSEDARVYAGVSSFQQNLTFQIRNRDGFSFQHSLQAFRGPDGQQRYSGVRTRDEAEARWSWNMSSDGYAGTSYPDKVVWDIDVSQAAAEMPIPEQWQHALADAEQSLRQRPKDAEARFARAQANLFLGHDEAARKDLDSLLQTEPRLLKALRLRALLHLQQGNLDAAQKDIQSLGKLPIAAFERKALALIERACQDDPGDGSSELPLLEDFSGSFDLLSLVRADQGLRGTWEEAAGTLISPRTSGACIGIPCKPPDSYTLRLLVTPEPNPPEHVLDGLVIGLMLQGRSFHVLVDFYNRLSAIENVDGQSDVSQNSTTVWRDVLQDGRAQLLECRVVPGWVRFRCEGKNIISWKGDASRLSQNGFWSLAKETLYLGAFKRYQLHALTLETEPGFQPLTKAERTLRLTRWLACGTHVLSRRGKERAAALWRSQAQHYLAAMLRESSDALPQLLADPWIRPVLDTPAMQSALREPRRKRDLRYSAVWKADPRFEARVVQGLAPEDQRKAWGELVRKGYRPLAVSTVLIEGQELTASSWHLPVPAERATDALALRQANAAVGLLRLGESEPVWPLFAHTPDPSRRSHLLARLEPLGVQPQAIVQRLVAEKDVSARRALILALGEYGADRLPASVRRQIVPRLLDWYRNDPDPGIHGAIDWLLRHGREGPVMRPLDWGQRAELEKTDAELAQKPEAPARQRLWYVNSQGQTLTEVRGPVEFSMGSPASEADHRADEVRHRRRIGRSFAIATKPVTVRQWEAFLRANPHIWHSYTKNYSPEPHGPIVGVTWYTAAQYCRWLSDTEGVPPEQMVYPTIAEIEKAKNGGAPLKLPADHLSRTGYRLPTEAEWEYACRAGAGTSRYYGSPIELLPRYGWFRGNSDERSWPVGQKRPNDLGLFDMHGNVWQWCQAGYSAHPPGPGSRPTEDSEDVREVTNQLNRCFRGGSFFDRPASLRSASRNHGRPSEGQNGLGLRIARTSQR